MNGDGNHLAVRFLSATASMSCKSAYIDSSCTINSRNFLYLLFSHEGMLRFVAARINKYSW